MVRRTTHPLCSGHAAPRSARPDLGERGDPGTRHPAPRSGGADPAARRAGPCRGSPFTSGELSELWIQGHAELDATVHDQEALHLAIDALLAHVRPEWPAAKPASEAFLRRYPDAADREDPAERAVWIILGGANDEARQPLAEKLAAARKRISDARPRS